ncbi:MAG: thymidylate synthase [Chloroflexi bacterium]|nr:thymidylate synthase [Chloroflexota bacterium]
MKITEIEARDLPEAWFLAIKNVMLHGREYVIDKGSFESRKRKELEFAAIHISHPGRRPLVPDVPEGVPAPTTEAYLQEYVLYLMTDQPQPGEDYTYGQDLAPQMDEVIRLYKKWGTGTNRLCMSVGSKDSLFQYRREEETGQQASSQCLRLVDTRISDGALHFIIYFRSWDLWGGFPSNLGGLQLMKEYMAGQIGVEDGEIVALSKGLHLYDYTWDLAKSVLRW